MQIATVGTKYQIVVPKNVRRKLTNLKPGGKVSVSVLDKDTIQVKVTSDKWSDQTYGSMKHAWKSMDPIVQLEKMRNEWT